MSNTSEGQSVLVTGRLVWTVGDLFNGRLKTNDLKQPVLDNNGEQVREYGFGLAVPKVLADGSPNPEFTELWQKLHEEAYKIYTNGQLPPGFAMKLDDGDGVDHKGEPFSKRTGYAGCMIVKATTRIPIKFFKWNDQTKKLDQISEGLKCGDYIQAQILMKAHGPVGQGKPGMYMNPLMAQWAGYGEAIVNAPSGEDVFGSKGPVIAAGASAAPIAPTSMPQAAAPQTAQPGQPAPMPAPNHNVLPQNMQPTQAQAAPQPAAAPAPAPSPTQSQAPAMPPMPQQQAQPTAAPAMPPVPGSN